jgi:hypothetical protein
MIAVCPIWIVELLVGSELQLEPCMGRFKTEALVESVCLCPGGVRGELNKSAAASPRFVDRPLEEVGAEAGSPMIRADPHSFDLAAKGAAPRQAGNHGELQRSDGLVIRYDDDQELVRIRVDVVEGLQVRDKVGRVVAGRAELVVRQHVHYRLDILTPCFADGVVGHGTSITAFG